ncbi:hypothetical protein KK141_20650 [Dyella sp. LX-66]|uniref:hypothetical protein n=1 Tax=unclassified Dyella TaxID=2634549 RepID=UPI001BDFE16B|nr:MULTISPECIES: hypothetical protein [unclassified Dyella]MBT2119618.1 hypothetical protein [Dyella sp. LX-1]MBT2141968.1 hypothetical protein [Dyella sp. LX-66]
MQLSIEQFDCLVAVQAGVHPTTDTTLIDQLIKLRLVLSLLDGFTLTERGRQCLAEHRRGR